MDVSLFQTLVDLTKETNPSVSGILTPAFLQTLKNCPASSTIFTTQLKSFDSTKGQALAIGDDCTVQYVNISGSTYYGQAGTGTLNSAVSGVGRTNFVHSTNGTPVTSFAVSGGTTTYDVFGIAFTAGSTPAATPAPASVWLAVTGCLVLAGYGLRLRRRQS